jgi:hypothetical protein
VERSNRSEVMRVSKEFNDYIRKLMKSYSIKNTSEATKIHLTKLNGNYDEKFKI